MKPVAKWLGWAIVAALVVIQFVQPARTNPPVAPEATIFAQTQMPEDVAGLLRRSCADCHSHETRWPWYSRVAPVSWVVVDDVNHARKHANFSTWQNLAPKDASKTVHEMCEEVSDQKMPLKSYVWMHREAALNEAERQRLCSWTKQEEARLGPVADSKEDKKEHEHSPK